ncbi:putative reductases with broad range of substrate specificitie [Rosellinia necatrix]|uniref:Putative reductases with broad range of substrate specificitie n=1 Tax=Rosellinia necatrix TaxID=77044 RepID=A0A1W2TKT7_ROSNE|nr:putative reductases with broad range of substrate specificitie [Rosellinia necatrix]
MGIVISTTRLHSVSVNASDGVTGNFDILQENSFVCWAKYGIKPVHLIRDKTHTSLSPIPNATTRVLHSLEASDLLDCILEPSFVGPLQPTWVSGVPLYSDSYTAFLYTLANSTQEDFSFPSSLDSLYSGDSFPQLVRSSFQKYAPILFLFAVSDPTSIPSSVLATVTEDRLVVQIIPTQVAAILMFTLVLFTIAIWFLDTRLSLPQNPNEMMGTAAVFAHNLMSLAGQGDACFDGLKMMLSPWTYHVRLQSNPSVEIELNQSRTIHQSSSKNGDKMRRVKSTNFRPLSLSTTLRLLASTFLSAIIIILEITLRNSQRDRGLGDAASHQNEIQFWAILPGFLSTLANTYCESMDFNTRIQSPLLRLVRGLTFQGQLNLDLLDCHTSLLLYREIQTRSFEASTSTAAVIITSFLMISSASLLFTARIPSVANVQLQAKNPIYYYSPWWSSGQTDLETATLTLLENISYPTLTYQDLVFPEIILERSLQSGASLQVATPAIHFDFTECRHYNATDINVTVTYPSSSVVEFAVQSEMGCTEPEGFSDLSTADKKNAYLGVTLSGCSRQLWVWGFWADPGGAADSLFGLGCNSTWKTVDTVATFDSQTMTVDIDKPPKVDFSTGVDLGSFVYMNGSDPYGDYYPVGSGSLSTDTTNWTAQDTFFNLLLHSRYALPLTYLRNADNVTAVEESILFHYKILLGQNLNANGRFAGPPTGPEDVGYRLFPGLNETIALNATVRDPIALNRIMQDPASTRILQALLGITLVCIATNWYLMHNAIALPRSPTTIGNWMALLADGNLNDYLPANAAHMPLKDLSRWYFGQNAKFYFGYRESPSTGQQVLGIYVVKNEDVTDEGTFHSALEAHDEQASREFCRDVWRSSL